MISVEDHSGADRIAWPVSGGIPFPKGEVFNIDEIGIHGKLSQCRILSRWGDGSIKWVLMDYQSDIGSLSVSADQIVKKANQATKDKLARETEDEIFVDTGILKLNISKEKFGFIDRAWLDFNANGVYEPDELIVEKNTGQDHFYDLQKNNPQRPTIPYSIRNLLTGSSRPVENATPTVEGGAVWMRKEGGGDETRVSAKSGFYEAKIVENGPLRCVVELKGSFGKDEGSNEYSIWVHAYANKSFFRVQHNFLFKGNPETTNIRRMALSLPLVNSGEATFKSQGMIDGILMNSGGSAYLYNSGPQDVFHLEYKGFPLGWRVGSEHEITSGIEQTEGWIEVSSKKVGVTMAMKDMALKYPKELSYNQGQKTLNAWIWPDHGNDVLDLRASGWVDGMQGVSFSHDIYYNFFHDSNAIKGKEFAAVINDPPQPYANPEWYSYKGTKAGGMLMPYDDSKFPKTEALLATGTAFVERSMTDFGWLGMLNYGDLMFMYAYQKGDRDMGTWGISSRPDDYDGWRRGNTMISYRLLMQYLRTGEYQYWKAASAHIQFVRDALIKHYNQADPRYVGFGRRHSAYWGIGPRKENDRTGGVAWDGYGTNWLGHYLHWNMTGDWRTYDVMKELRHTWKQWGNHDIDQISGSAFVGLKLFGGVPGFEEAENEAEDFLQMAVHRTSNPGDLWRDNTWFFGYGLYLQDNPKPEIKKAILDWWKADQHEQDPWGLYWHRESMAAAYWAADDNSIVRDKIYKELVRVGSSESLNSPRIEKQNELYNMHGLSGLFDSDISALANAVTADTPAGYWRAKDDIIQLQWDEPLGMAVIDHYKENLIALTKIVKSESDWFDLEIDSSVSDGLFFKVKLDKPSGFELEVFDAVGHSVWHLNRPENQQGEYEITWKEAKVVAASKTSGFYIARLIVGNDRKARKFILQ